MTAYPPLLPPKSALPAKFGNSVVCPVRELVRGCAIVHHCADRVVEDGSKSADVDNAADNRADETDDNVDCCSDCTCQPERSGGMDTLLACSIHSCCDHSHNNDGGAMNVTVLVVYIVGGLHCIDTLIYLRRGGRAEGARCHGKEMTSNRDRNNGQMISRPPMTALLARMRPDGALRCADYA